MARNKPTSQLTSKEQFLQLAESFETAREKALIKLSSREEGEFKPGSLNWWSGKVGSIITQASDIKDKFQRGQVALKTFDDSDSIDAIGKAIKESARKNLEEIIRTSVTMYYQFCMDVDQSKRKGTRK
ncbi:hypothetical protein DLM76_17130 [Leptospira yasudae]|uniref:hypothetical protein n=1 Tax=Leptospira yasudae TaxID=2202201 RepID=UPI000E59E82B|nr:hypothetical protein [Leptospira yasudae]RHX91451.1 hypothetical protein DLM76_17130 [Leptospira yasudae]